MSDVLIVDDEPAVAVALRIRLQAAGLTVEHAATGQAGLEAARWHEPGVILLDIRLPDLDGFEVYRRLKADPSLRSIPVIFLSANMQESARARSMEMGAYSFLSKPYEPAPVMAAVKSALTAVPRSRPTRRDERMTEATRRRILIIDNDERVTRAIETRLENLGYECAVAHTGAQGLAEFRSRPADLVISDVNMPAGDGITIAEELRKSSDVPIIFVTGFRAEYGSYLRALPRVTVMEKPFDAQDLQDLVEAELFSGGSAT
jgi:DNA-binding response OmpR family regulator